MQIIAKGTSMLPTLIEGCSYYAEPVKASNLRVGDIIVYYINGKIICHRIVKLIVSRSDQIFIRTKGDNNSSADSYAVLPQFILGRIRL